jgi:hypothetical protein
MTTSATAGTAAAITWGQPVDNLRLGLTTAGTTVGLHLQNTGATPLEVMSHVATHELHLDWYTLQVTPPDGAPFTIRLYDSRNRSAPIKQTLAPGEALAHRIDAVAWAARPANGSHTLSPGMYQLAASYDVPADAGVWAGRLKAGPVEWVLAEAR